MSLATGALDARGARRVVVAAIAAALQGIFCWLILRETVEPIALPGPRPLEVTILQTVSRLRPAKQPRKHRRRTPRQQMATRVEASRRVERTNPIAPPQAVNSPSHAPLDWQQAMHGEVRAEESRSSAGKVRFGFPRQPAPAPAAAKFGWDYASTHRLEALRRGGILINLNDHCALVFYGLMLFPGCRIGRIAVNGHLFDHMRDRRNGSGGLP
ncbi:MAG: hypothetical protein ACYDAE_20380 [Steroidobacteraceae bacterium]